MKKNIFVLSLMALALSACSGGGGGSAGEPSTTATQAGEKRVKLVKATGTLANLNTEEGIQKLLADMNERANFTIAACGSATGCNNNLAAGTLLGKYQQSYTGYAAIRGETSTETDAAGHRSKPMNSFVALVMEPTTNRAAVVDAEYKGMVSYSRQNSGTVVNRDTLTMRVQGSQISGEVVSINNKNESDTVMRFNPAEIRSENNQVAFNGSAVFYPRYFGASDYKDYDNQIEGVYQGQFGGANAEEVVGTFNSNNTSYETSVQGAFAAKK